MLAVSTSGVAGRKPGRDDEGRKGDRGGEPDPDDRGAGFVRPGPAAHGPVRPEELPDEGGAGDRDDEHEAEGLLGEGDGQGGGHRAGLGPRVRLLHVDEGTEGAPEEPHDDRGQEGARGGSPGQAPRPATRPVPDLGREVGQGQEHEGQRSVVVVLERRPVDARPGQPERREHDRHERQGEAAPSEGLPRREGEGWNREPPGRQVAAVVDRSDRVAGEGLLVEPDRLQVGGPGPPRRRRGVGRPQVVVVVVHPADEVRERLSVVPRRPPRHDLVPQGGPRQIGDDVDEGGDPEQAEARPDDRQACQPARAAAIPPAPARPAPAGRPGHPARAEGRADRGRGGRPARTPRRRRRRSPSARRPGPGRSVRGRARWTPAR